MKSLAKQIGDRQRGNMEPMKDRSKLTNSLELPRGKWTPHDLRRTGATLMGTASPTVASLTGCFAHQHEYASPKVKPMK